MLIQDAVKLTLRGGFVCPVSEPDLICRSIEGTFYPLGQGYLTAEQILGQWSEVKARVKPHSLSSVFADWLEESEANDPRFTLSDLSKAILGKEPTEKRWTLKDLL